jgi:glycine C-acetyltransferase
MSKFVNRLRSALEQLHRAGTYKVLREITAPMDTVTKVAGIGEVMVFCSNNYLGLANHPEVIQAGIDGLKKYGAGTASVRFICGTFECHRLLEESVAEFFGTEAALTYGSCWNANEGLLPALVEQGDAILSDELNHASIIDSIRLARQADRKVFAHSDMRSLAEMLYEVRDAEVKLVVTDGVFSMEGDVAKLDEIVPLCRQHNATLVVDDSHGTGVLGRDGKGTHEHFGLPARGPAGIDVITSTFGKALGGGSGGLVAGPRDIVDYLVQRSRPHLFSNALAPVTACTAIKALEVLRREPHRVTKLRENAATMRDGLRSLGYEVIDSPTGIIPIIIGETADAIRLSQRLLEMGILVTGFGFPVVPEGQARLRVQMSSAHSDEQITRTLEAFQKLKS